MLEIGLLLSLQNGRGAVGKDEYNSQHPGNIAPEDGNWDWGSFEDGTKNMTKDDDGTYRFEWTFQTNSSNNGYILDSLEMNGVLLTIPFKANTSETTELTNGAKVTIKYVRDFNTSPIQRVYTVEITGARTDIVVTGGNFQIGTGSPELIPSSLTGVNTIIAEEEEYQQSAPIIDASTVKFKLMDGYEITDIKSAIKLTNIEGVDYTEDIDISLKNGEYIISSLKEKFFDEGNRIALLTVNATPIKYAVLYTNGGIDSAELNTKFDNNFDDNGGKYYTIENSKIITVSKQIPEDSGKVFVEWTNENISSPIIPGTVLELKDVNKYAKDNGKGIHVLTLDASWNDAPNLLDYYVTLQWGDTDRKTQEEVLQHIQTQNYIKDGALDIVVNENANVLLEWLAQNPKYSLSDKNDDYVYENIYDQDTFYIYLEEKQIEDNNDENDQSNNVENVQDNNNANNLLTEISPSTGDNIIIYVVILAVSITLIIVTRKLNKKQRKIDKHY